MSQDFDQYFKYQKSFNFMSINLMESTTKVECDCAA